MKTSVTSSLEQNTGNIQDARTRASMLVAALPEGSTIANNIRRVSETHLHYLFRSVACVGLRRWAPDVLSKDPDSMYNLLHEHIALTTFEQMAGSCGYDFTGIVPSFARDFVLMRKMYRSFVYSYMYDIAKTEAKSPGHVAKDKQMSAVWRRRQDVSLYLLSYT